MDLGIALVLLIFGFVILIKGADFLVDGASSVAKKFNISDMIIGLTIVSFGTSAPELVVNIGAALEGKNAMIIGNVLGSNIFNTCLILGVAGLIYPLAVQKATVRKELPFSIFIIVLMFLLANDQLLMGGENYLSHLDGGIFLLFFLCFLYYVYSSSKDIADSEGGDSAQEMPSSKSLFFILLGISSLVLAGYIIPDIEMGSKLILTGISLIDGVIFGLLFLGFFYSIYLKSKNSKEKKTTLSITLLESLFLISLGMVGLVYGGNLVLVNSVKFAEHFGMTERVIGLTVIAIGTSLPELATSVVAALKKNSDIAMGNIVGSNIFNILLVLGVSASVSPSIIEYDAAANFDIGFLLTATILLTSFLFIGTRVKPTTGGSLTYTIDRWQSGVLLVAVIGYIVYLLMSQ